jgi:hypothetical protein
MKTTLRIVTALSISILILLASCAPNTKIIGSWKSPGVGDKKYSDLFVMGISDNFIGRKTFEEDFQQILKEKGIKSIISVNVLNPNTRMNQIPTDEIVAAIQKEKADGVLTMTVIDQTSETRYVQGSAYPVGGYGFRGYYGMYAPMAYSPGYYATDKSYFIEIKLFDVNSNELVWSAQSETVNPSNLESAAMTFSRVVVGRMIKDGVIAGPK